MHILFCPRECYLLEGIEVSALPGYDCFWIRTACETGVLLVDVGFCARFAVSLYLEATSLQMVRSEPEC